MSLEAVLVDRARLIRTSASSVRVEGRTTMVETEPGTWFDCRLFLPQSPESFDPNRVSRRTVVAPTLLYGIDDEDGNEFVVKATDTLEVDSDDLGRDTWQVTADPQPLRKREGIIGWQVTLKRIKVETFEAKT